MSSDTATTSELPREEWTLVDLVARRAAEHGDRTFATFLDDRPGRAPRTLSFAEWDQQSTSIAGALADLGVRPGDRVLAMMANSERFLTAMIGAHKAGASFVPVNTELKGAFLEHQLTNSAPGVILTDATLAARFELVDIATSSAHTVVVNRITGDADLPDSLGNLEQLDFDDLADRSATAELPEPSRADVCTIMYTSGTTGPAKGVLMPQAHCVLFGKGAAEAMGLTSDDHYFVCMPFFHANGLFMQVYSALWAGATLTAVELFSASRWLDQVIDCDATVTNALGVMPEFIFRRPPDPRDRSHRLRAIMAIPIAEDWGEAMQERFGVQLVQGFGMTEVNMVAYSDPADPVIAGCAGRVLDDFFEVIVADPETDEPLPADTVGEILVRPKDPFCFNVGYHEMPDRTVEAWRNLWFHTGDAARFDHDGRLHFVDRIKDRIRRRGENISSYEVEQVLNAHPAVAESAAVGVKVEGAGGEEEILAVLATGDQRPDPVELLDWCVERMPRHTVPRFVQFVDELDKTASGKIRKQAIRDAGVTDQVWDRESVGYTIARGS